MGCTVGDLDNNGWPDLVVTGIDSNKVYSNTGNAQFRDITGAAGIAAERWSTGATLADYNNDSLVDIYLTNYVAFRKGARTYERNKGFVTAKVPFDATLYDPLPNKLYLNQGDFTFRDATATAGVADNLGRSLGAHWTDLDGDGWQDLIVINDVDSPSQVYLNKRGERFVPSQSRYALIETPESRDILEEDFNNDGINELLITQNGGAVPILASRQNEHSDKYTDSAWQSGIADRNSLGLVNWGATGGDFNNDGNIDLYIANGGLEPDLDSPYVTQPQHNQLMLGLGDGTFLQAAPVQHPSYPLSSRSAITADLNNDGNLEIIVSNNNDPLQIFENVGDAQQPWVGFDIFSNNTFSQATGARISVEFAGDTIERTARQRQGFLSSSDARVHIGLGSQTASVDVTIDWPDGTQSAFADLNTGAYYAVDKNADSITRLPAPIDHTAAFRKAVAHYDNEARINLGRLLLQMEGIEATRQFSALWATSDNPVKVALLTLLDQAWHPNHLRYVQDAIYTDSETLKLQAIGILRALELEYSIPWLIALMQSEPDTVRCAAANTLQFFFEEEEAATHRKYLAVAPLIQMLESSSADAAVCAANALAAAESKRAVRPLIAQARERPEREVKVAAVRALGLVRDNQALGLLTGIAESPGRHSSDVVAAALIALQRLGATGIEAYLDGIFSENSAEVELNSKTRFQIANSLMANSETIVFPKTYLTRKLTDLLAEQPLEAIAEKDGDADLKTEILLAIRLAQLTQYRPFAEQLLRDKQADVRRYAYETVFALDRDAYTTLLPTMLDREASSLVLNVLRAGGRQGRTLETTALEQLGTRLGSHGPMAAELEAVLDSLNMASARELLRTVYSRDLPEDHVQTLLALCDTHSAAISAALSSPTLQQRPPLKYVYLYCVFSDEAFKKTPANQKLANRILLKQVIESSAYSDPEKHRLIIRASADDRVTAETFLLEAVQGFTGDALLQALEVLSRQQLSGQLSPFLWGLLQDDDTPLAIRFEAATLLLQIERKAVSDYVNSEILTHATN